MTSHYPVPFTWDGSAMVPKRGFAGRCDKQFVVGETYRLDVVEDRSSRSHAHFFACVADVHANLPEELAEQFPTSDMLRKHALIRCGYCNSQQTICQTRGEAIRLAAILNAIREEYAIVTVSGCVVTRLTAKSQAVRAMPAKEFQESKTKVLDFIASLIGVSADELGRHAGQAA